MFLAAGASPADQAAATKQGIAVVWQDLALCDNLDVAANIHARPGTAPAC